MKIITYFLLFIGILLISCKKNKPVEEPVPFSKRTILFEKFDSANNWTVIPSANDTGCVKIEEGCLKLTFDQTFDNCGCGWVGAKYKNENIYEIGLSTKIGIRILLKKGFFQDISIYRNEGVSQSGVRLLFSSFEIHYNSFSIYLPSRLNGDIHEDSTLNLNLNKLEGKEFEIIYNNGECFAKIDGVKYSSNILTFNYPGYPNVPLSMKFQLGHLPELSPRQDTLYIDEIEVYTWSGEM